MDHNTSVSVLKEKVTKFRDERNWLKFHNPKDLSIALSIEAAELQELFLWKDEQSSKRVRKDTKRMERIEEEMADIGIYLLSLADVLDVDLSEALIRKLAQNALKYPIVKSKGSSKKYNELQA